MKLINGIQSISDVITNSSSEVFLMRKSDAEYYEGLENTKGCVNIQEITWDWIINDGLWEWEMICEYLDIDKSIISRYYKPDPSKEDWLTFIDIYKDKIEKELIGLYFVDIEDHFEDAYTVTDNARSDSLWCDYRH